MNNEIKEGFGFRATGTVTRVFVVSSGRCAFVTLQVNDGERSRKHELRAFDGAVVSRLSELAPGALVTLTGSVDCEALKDKARNDVQADGRTVWVEKPTIKSVKVERAAAPPPSANDLHGDDEPMF